MYSGVPHTNPRTVSIELLCEPCRLFDLAMPKSQTFTRSSSPRRSTSMMLAGFRSRWMTPWAWASSSAASTWDMIRTMR
jgi:hypothetical protein